MTNYQLKQATDLRKNKDYKYAIAIYQTLWEKDQDQFSEWDGWSFAYCLTKCNHYEKALTICRNLYFRFKDFEMNRSLYARCIYYTQFMQSPLPNLSVLTKAVQAMLELSPPHSRYSFTTIAIFKLTKMMMQQHQINWEGIESWMQKLDPDLLNDQPFSITDPRGKKRELASQLEQWYATMIKVKAGFNQPKQLLELLNIARKRQIKWHYNNDIWFARKEAFAYQQLGEKEKAAHILRKITRIKPDWFLLFDLARVVSDKKEALQLFCKAALSKGKNEMKVKLYGYLYTEIGDKPEFNREAALHLCLIVALREENNWEVKDDLLEEIRKRGIDNLKQGSSSKIVEALIPFWKKLSGEEVGKRIHGNIDHILPNNLAGFIKAGKPTYFFSLKGIKEELKPGQKVTFELIDSYDKKKNKASKRAIKIKIEK